MPKVLHVIGSLKPGGAETWYMNMLRRMDQSRFPTTICCLLDTSGPLEKEAIELGARVVHIDRYPNFERFSREFTAFLRAERFDVVHAHLQFFCGVLLRMAKTEGVGIRIAHARTAGEQGANKMHRVLYRWYMRRLLDRYCTSRIAVSNVAADFMFGKGSRYRQSVRLLSSGIDCSRFAVSESKAALCQSLGLPADATVFGHVGGFRHAKNHEFLMMIASELFRRMPSARMVCVGDGTERPRIQELAKTLGVADRVLFTGPRSDVPELMKYLFDVLVFPSHYEGLPQTIVEAQCAGLPSLISDAITPEVTIISELVAWESLENDAGRWADKAIDLARLPRYDKVKAYDVVRASRFEFGYHTTVLEQIYTGMVT